MGDNDNAVTSTRRGSEYIITLVALIIQVLLIGMSLQQDKANIGTSIACIIGSQAIIAAYIVCRSWVKVASLKKT
jgi:hypothetical protein